jgi:hypothetical protein
MKSSHSFGISLCNFIKRSELGLFEALNMLFQFLRGPYFSFFARLQRERIVVVAKETRRAQTEGKLV